MLSDCGLRTCCCVRVPGTAERKTHTSWRKPSKKRTPSLRRPWASRPPRCLRTLCEPARACDSCGPRPPLAAGRGATTIMCTVARSSSIMYNLANYSTGGTSAVRAGAVAASLRTVDIRTPQHTEPAKREKENRHHSIKQTAARIAAVGHTAQHIQAAAHPLAVVAGAVPNSSSRLRRSRSRSRSSMLTDRRKRCSLT